MFTKLTVDKILKDIVKISANLEKFVEDTRKENEEIYVAITKLEQEQEANAVEIARATKVSKNLSSIFMLE